MAITHRALRHHLEGVAEAVAHFGADIRNTDSVEIDTMTLGVQHLEEDCPRIVTARDWLVGFDAPDWLPAALPDAEDLAHGRHGTTLRLLDRLSDAEVVAKLPVHLRYLPDAIAA